jgi:hypothetical protein
MTTITITTTTTIIRMTITTTTDNKYLKIILWIDKYVNIDNIFMSKYI